MQGVSERDYSAHAGLSPGEIQKAMPSIRVWPFFTSSGSKLPSRSGSLGSRPSADSRGWTASASATRTDAERSACDPCSLFLASRPEHLNRGIGPKIPLDNMLHNFGIQLLDLDRIGGSRIGPSLGKRRRHVLDRRPLPRTDLGRMHDVLLPQLR